MQTPVCKPSKAMLFWLDWLAKGGRIERTAASSPVAVRAPKRIGWEMLDKLEAGGWVVWSKPFNASEKYRIIKYRVLLTESGTAAVSDKC